MTDPEPLPVRPRRKRNVLVAVTVACVAICLTGYYFLREPCLARLEVGNQQLRLVKIVEGRLQHRDHDLIPSWVRSNIPVVNRWVAFRFPTDIDSKEQWHTDQGVWFVFEVDQSPGTPLCSFIGYNELEIESGGSLYKGQSWGGWVGHGQVLVYRADSVPRRDRTLRIQLKSSTGEPLAMTVDNPLYREEFPEWTAGPMPFQASRGPFTVELTDIVRGTDGGAYPIVKVTCRDPTLEPCQVFANLEDATGNRGPFVSPFETTWKVVASVHIPVTAQSPLNRRFPLGKVQVPPANTVVPWPITFEDGDVNLQIRHIVGPGHYEQINGQWIVVDPTQPRKALSLGRVVGPAVLCDYFHGIVQVKIVVKSSGEVRVASMTGESRSLTSGTKKTEEGRSIIELHDDSPGDEIELELIRSRPEVFEFLVTPPEALKTMLLPQLPQMPGDSRR